MSEHTPAPTPHRAVYGYAFYLLMSTIFMMYVLWALVLPILGGNLFYLPDKYFAIVLPMLVLVSVPLFVVFIYPAINMALTPDIDDMSSVVDVDLILKGTSKRAANSWKELIECINPPKVNNSELPSIRECTFCSASHKLPKTSEQINSLHFVDLVEINKHLFE